MTTHAVSDRALQVHTSRWAQTHRAPGFEREDWWGIFQVARFEAEQTFDPTRCASLATYSWVRIKQAGIDEWRRVVGRSDKGYKKRGVGLAVPYEEFTEEVLGDENPHNLTEDCVFISQLYERLSDREREALRLYVAGEGNGDEIGPQMGVCRSRGQQYISSIRRKARAALQLAA